MEMAKFLLQVYIMNFRQNTNGYSAYTIQPSTSKVITITSSMGRRKSRS